MATGVRVLGSACVFPGLSDTRAASRRRADRPVRTLYARAVQDLFTAEDRAELNASFATGSGERYAQLLLENPRPGGGARWGTRIGGIVIALIVGGILSAALEIIGLILLVVLIVAALAVSGRLAAALHRRSLRAKAQEALVGEWATERGWR